MKKNNKPHLTRVFGLVALDDQGILRMSRSLTQLSDLLPALAAHEKDDEIFPLFHGIRPNEIATARAYMTRFGGDVKGPKPLPEGPKAILLDECTPLQLLPFVNRTFGVSSHVEAEGLSINNLRGVAAQGSRKKVDTHIAGFVLKNGFGALATRDSDFITLVKQEGHPASKINIIMVPDQLSAEETQSLLYQNQSLIRDRLQSSTPFLWALQ